VFKVSPFLNGCIYAVVRTRQQFTVSVIDQSGAAPQSIVSVTYLAAAQSIRQPPPPPNRVVHWIEIRAVRWPVQWTDEVGCLFTACSGLVGKLAGTLSCWNVKKLPDRWWLAWNLVPTADIGNWYLWKQFVTRNSTDADKPARRLQRSVKVIESGTTR